MHCRNRSRAPGTWTSASQTILCRASPEGPACGRPALAQWPSRCGCGRSGGSRLEALLLQRLEGLEHVLGTHALARCRRRAQHLQLPGTRQRGAGAPQPPQRCGAHLWVVGGLIDTALPIIFRVGSQQPDYTRWSELRPPLQPAPPQMARQCPAAAWSGWSGISGRGPCRGCAAAGAPSWGGCIMVAEAVHCAFWELTFRYNAAPAPGLWVIGAEWRGGPQQGTPRGGGAPGLPGPHLAPPPARTPVQLPRPGLRRARRKRLGAGLCDASAARCVYVHLVASLLSLWWY